MSTDDKSNLLWGIVLLMMLATLGVVYYKYHDYFATNADLMFPYDPDCDLKAGKCETRLDNHRSVSFSITPSSIPLMQPLQMEVRTNGLVADKVEVDFAGVDMNMGFNRNSLSLVEPGYYRGEATLPVCIRNRMEWEAQVMLYTGSGLISVPFRFETTK